MLQLKNVTNSSVLYSNMKLCGIVEKIIFEKMCVQCKNILSYFMNNF